MPKSASVKDIFEGYLLGEELGLKALAVFRSESKPTSVLGYTGTPVLELKRGEKKDLPFSGSSFRQEVKIDGNPFLVNIGEYPDGTPGEVVIESFTGDSTLGELIRVAGIGASKALKRGIDLEDVVAGWVGHGFAPKGFVTVDEPAGPHPIIKMAASPLDFVGKLLLINYKGQTDLATEPDKVDAKSLRGAQNGAFKEYHRRSIDEWNFNQVINDSTLGGFVEFQGSEREKVLMGLGKNGEKDFKNASGKVCDSCGNLMRQTAPNCYKCSNCGDSVGGCGA